MKFYAATRRVHRALYRRGWTKSHMDNTVRSRIAHAVGDWSRWYDWGHPVMWLVGRYDCGSAGAPRGRDLWWVPTGYVEGLATSLVADFEKRHSCYVTSRYEDVRLTSGDIDWRVFDLQDDGRVVKIGLWPNRPEHNDHIQGLPWAELVSRTSLRLFLDWYLIDHKIKAQWFGLRSWIYGKALHAAVHAHSPFACGTVPPQGSGGYSHWHCEVGPLHRGPHRYRNYTWDDGGVKFAPVDAVRQARAQEEA